ncbi:glycosyltransferase involved in cell wall biosynthesis [Bradyrhizobium sp. RT4a]
MRPALARRCRDPASAQCRRCLLERHLHRRWEERESDTEELGRLTAEKGPEDAIRIARAVGMPLRIAAKIPRAETAYFKKKLEPKFDGEEIKLIGEVDEVRKQPFLAGVAALLFPIDWPKPFGLVLIEAMACGTPVIAYRSGSVPEVVEDGVTGFKPRSNKTTQQLSRAPRSAAAPNRARFLRSNALR